MSTARSDGARSDGARSDDKAGLRRELLAARAAVDSVRHAAEASAIADTVAAMELPGVVCAYVPFGTEPGSIALLDAMAARGVRVLLPVVAGPGALHWSVYAGPDSLTPGPYGIPAPAGPVLPTAEITAAGLVLVPALAVDRAGVRLGRGAGFYDRTLPHARPDTRLIAVVRDDEILPHLPAEPHDIPVGAALTPRGGLVRFRGGLV